MADCAFEEGRCRRICVDTVKRVFLNIYKWVVLLFFRMVGYRTLHREVDINNLELGDRVLVMVNKLRSMEFQRKVSRPNDAEGDVLVMDEPVSADGLYCTTYQIPLRSCSVADGCLYVQDVQELKAIGVKIYCKEHRRMQE